MAGSGDKAEDKERWFMEAFSVDSIFTPERPIYSAKGAVVTNVAHIPSADRRGAAAVQQPDQGARRPDWSRHSPPGHER
jgi:hypothetical protein